MIHHPRHPSLYEINTRVLLNSLGPESTLADIPGKYWKDLRSKGIDWVWLMGIWEIQEKALDPYLIPQGMMDEFHALMHDLTEDDISGSPYAIHDYVIDPSIGTARQLKDLKTKLHKLGMKLMLDFVPNHFGAHTRWIEEHPEYFIEVQEEDFLGMRKTYYRPWYDRNIFFARGKDPFFDAWQDTVQVNYANPATHVWMTQILENIAGMCDGVRCDMAMLPVLRIFKQTWGHVVKIKHDQIEFWPTVISGVKKTHPHFLFLAECYWDMETELMGMGFDYCYDKVFYDRMYIHEVDKMRLHFHAEPSWLMRTARFLENHDEQRSASLLHLERHMATAALVAFGPGMRFWHMGQWEGRRKKVPVQICRNPHEPTCGCIMQKESTGVTCTCIQSFYWRLLELNQEAIFREGEWRVVHEHAAVHGLICWLWKHHHEQALVAINFSDNEAVFSLADQLHLLYLKNPLNIFSGNRPVDPHQTHTLSPWGVYVWKVQGKS
ncbi:MAG TPA: alpha-amylase family glycosyl hydrolase [Saprospiraceae bacterium]|nr:alpha-amylase family glycosyl hydrolase [Saprospiraceae bacterium]